MIPTLTGADAEFSALPALCGVTFTEIEAVDITGTIDELAIREDLSPDFVDGAPDTIMLTQICPRLAVSV